jgi:hypothetical protein
MRSNPRHLTFWHWSSVTPYTSSYEFAGSCVFDKQSPSSLLLQPKHLTLARCGSKNLELRIRVFPKLLRNFGHNSLFFIHYSASHDSEMLRQALFRSYGWFFAEFLGEHSLVRLRLLDAITCVGLRYGFHANKLRDFSWKRALPYFPRLPSEFSLRLEVHTKVVAPGLT